MTMLSRIALAGTWFLATRQLVAAGCSISSNYTIIDSPDDTDSISSCRDIDGSLSLLFGNSPAKWDSDKTTVELGGVASITGDLIIYADKNIQKTVVSASSLKTVDGALTISNIGTSGTVKSLQVSFPALQSVGSNYVITGGLTELVLEHGEGLHVEAMMRINSINTEDLKMSGLYQVDGDLSIDSNKYLKQVEMGSLGITEMAFIIKENPVLEAVSFPKLKSVGGDLSFYKNPKLNKVQLPALEFADTISMTSNGGQPTYSFPRLASLGKSNTTATSTFQGVSKIQLPSLGKISGSLTFQSTSLTDLTLPLLKFSNGSMTVQDNPSLTTFALPRVTKAAEFYVKGNDKLTNITMNALKSVGTISLKGSFTNVEFFGLEEVTGDFKVVGDESMDCSWFDDNVRKIVSGSYNCVGNHDKKERKSSTGGIENTEGNPEDYITSDGEGDSKDGGSGGKDGKTSEGGESKSSDKGSGSKGLSTGVQAGIGVGVTVFLLSIVAIIVLFLWRRWRRSPPQPDNNISSENHKRDTDIYDGRQPLGVHTRIEANSSVATSIPSLGTLDFSKSSFLDGSASGAGSEKELGPWKTIRRVSDSTSGTGTSDHVKS